MEFFELDETFISARATHNAFTKGAQKQVDPYKVYVDARNGIGSISEFDGKRGKITMYGDEGSNISVVGGKTATNSKTEYDAWADVVHENCK